MAAQPANEADARWPPRRARLIRNRSYGELKIVRGEPCLFGNSREHPGPIGAIMKRRG